MDKQIGTYMDASEISTVLFSFSCRLCCTSKRDRKSWKAANNNGSIIGVSGDISKEFFVHSGFQLHITL